MIYIFTSKKDTKLENGEGNMKAIIGNKRYDCMVIERATKVRRNRGYFMKEWADAILVGVIFCVWFLFLYLFLV